MIIDCTNLFIGNVILALFLFNKFFVFFFFGSSFHKFFFSRNCTTILWLVKKNFFFSPFTHGLSKSPSYYLPSWKKVIIGYIVTILFRYLLRLPSIGCAWRWWLVFVRSHLKVATWFYWFHAVLPSIGGGGATLLKFSSVIFFFFLLSFLRNR